MQIKMLYKQTFKKAFLFLSASLISILSFIPDAFAQDCGGAVEAGTGNVANQTVGSVICNIVVNASDLPALFAGFCYLAGIYFGAVTVFKIKSYVEDPKNTTLFDPMKTILIAGGLFALPTVAEAAYTMMSGDSGIPNAEASGFAGTETPGEGLDNIMVRFVGDIWDNVFFLLGGFGYLAGIILVIVGIFRLLKTERDGPQGPLGFGTVMTFVVAGALFALDPIMGAFTTSYFEENVVRTTPSLQPRAGLNDEEISRIHGVISAVVAFMFIVGWISFIRGWFILRDVTDGGGGKEASLMAALTHIIGGALAVNLGPVMNAVQETLGITSYGVLFN